MFKMQIEIPMKFDAKRKSVMKEYYIIIKITTMQCYDLFFWVKTALNK